MSTTRKDGKSPPVSANSKILNAVMEMKTTPALYPFFANGDLHRLTQLAKNTAPIPHEIRQSAQKEITRRTLHEIKIIAPICGIKIEADTHDAKNSVKNIPNKQIIVEC